MSDRRARRIFRGVFPRDKLPQCVDKHRPAGYVINTGKSDTRGMHWTACYYDGAGKIEYMDSFGFSADMYEDIYKFILKHSTRYTYNKRLLQDVVSSMCGYYVIYFLLMKSRGVSMQKILSVFHPTNLYANDTLVFKRVQQILR